jgi:arylsulfatase A-like enzyme
MLHEVDKVVGSLFVILESRNLTEDTIFILTRDNGGLNKLRSDHLASGPLCGHKGNGKCLRRGTSRSFHHSL